MLTELSIQFGNLFRQPIENSTPFFLRVDLSEGVVFVVLVNPRLLSNRENVENKIVQIQTRRKTVEEQRHHNRHQPDHRLLPWILD